MSASTTATTAGSPMAREVGLLHAAFPTDGKWDNTWNIMREYNRAGNQATVHSQRSAGHAINQPGV